MNHLPQAPVSRRAKLLLLSIGLVVSLGALEVLFRAIGAIVKPARWNDRPFVYVLPEGSHTLQDADPHPKPDGAFRIAVVGDSFTFAPNMQLKDTFPKQLEQMLNENVEAPQVEVLNRGKSGASTESEVELVKKALAEKPDLLVLEITLNDAEPHILSKREREALFKPQWLTWRIFSWWKTLGFIATRIHNSQSVSRYVDYHSKFFKDPVTLNRFRSALKRIKVLADEAKVPLVAMVFPLFDFPVNQQYPFHETHSIISAELRALGVSRVDLRRAYRNIPPERLQVIPGEDNHPNEIAHRIAAERLLACLVKEGLLPKAVIPKYLFDERKDLYGPGADSSRIWKRGAKGLFFPAGMRDAESDTAEPESVDHQASSE